MTNKKDNQVPSLNNHSIKTKIDEFESADELKETAIETDVQQKNWYALHTASGQEDLAARNLEQRTKSLKMENKIFNILVPKEKKIKIKNGKRVEVETKIYPGYVLIEMVVNNESWYVVRSTPKITGFVGAGTVPIPVSKSEIDFIKKYLKQKEKKVKIDLKVGDLVKIIDGPLKNLEGKIATIDFIKEKVKINIDMFGRDTKIELDLLQIKKI